MPVSDRAGVIAVGTGIAGLVAALRAARTRSVILVTKAELGESIRGTRRVASPR